MMVKAMFTGVPNVIQHFVNCEFDVNATFYGITVLTWAEYLAYDEDSRFLKSNKAFRKK